MIFYFVLGVLLLYTTTVVFTDMMSMSCTWYIHTRYQLYPPFILEAPLFSLPQLRNSDPGSHSRLFSPPPLTTVRALHFYHENI